MKIEPDVVSRKDKKDGGHHCCPNCGWKLSEDDPGVEEKDANTAKDPGEDPLLVPVADRIDFFATENSRGGDERRYKRLRAKFKAAIRIGTEEDIVDVQDFSRRGLRFWSSRLYQPDTIVEVASPYTIGGNNIFAAARIVRMNRRPTESVNGEYAIELLP